METNNYIKERPSFGRSFGQGMQVLGDNFLYLLLIIIIMMFIQGPAQFVRVTIQLGGFNLAIGVFAAMALSILFLLFPYLNMEPIYYLFMPCVSKRSIINGW